jgi:hypothetical protein
MASTISPTRPGQPLGIRGRGADSTQSVTIAPLRKELTKVRAVGATREGMGRLKRGVAMSLQFRFKIDGMAWREEDANFL